MKKLVPLLFASLWFGCGDSTRAPCDELDACCSTLAGAAAASCGTALATARNSLDTTSACQRALADVRSSGSCLGAAIDAAVIVSTDDGGARDLSTQARTCTPRPIRQPLVRCQPATVTCLDAATTDAAKEACLASDAACAECIDAEFFYCAASPGARCARLWGCQYECVEDACGPNVTESCELRVNEAECKADTDALIACLDSDLAANATCVAAAETYCKSAAKCGNGVRDTGELCDGNCPTSCPPSTASCMVNQLQGSAATCDAQCVLVADPSCGSGCPPNPTPSSGLGRGVFTGSFLTEKNRIEGQCLYPNAPDAVFVWKAPQAGTYTFSAPVTYSYASFGTRYDTFRAAYWALRSGTTCATSTLLSCANYQRDDIRVTLTAGQEVLIVASFPTAPDATTQAVYKADYSINIELCAPNCSGKSCGSDGCGGSCGTCGPGTTCSTAGVCQCVPNCSGKSCGPNGCGGSCGTCLSGRTCSTSGQCVCTPDCTNKVCGDNGCGGQCGTCGLGTSCSVGRCVADPNACDPVANLGCTSTNECWVVSGEQTMCAIPGTGVQGSSCTTTSNCDGGYGCFVNVCRKLCDIATGDGCTGGLICNGIGGWIRYGACTTAP